MSGGRAGIGWAVSCDRSGGRTCDCFGRLSGTFRANDGGAWGDGAEAGRPRLRFSASGAVVPGAHRMAGGREITSASLGLAVGGGAAGAVQRKRRDSADGRPIRDCHSLLRRLRSGWERGATAAARGDLASFERHRMAGGREIASASWRRPRNDGRCIYAPPPGRVEEEKERPG
jgi:hypothetical protein